MSLLVPACACRTRHKRACEVVACEARTLTTEICAYLPKLPRAKPRTSSRPQQSSAPIGRLGWQTSPSRPAVSTRPRSRLSTVAPRGSRQSATFVSRIHGCDGCGLCHSLARCASAQNERTKDLAAHTCGRSRLLTAAPCFSSQSTTSVVRLFASSRHASSAPALTLHRVRGNVGLLTAQRAIDGARAPPLILCAADN